MTTPQRLKIEAHDASRVEWSIYIPLPRGKAPSEAEVSLSLEFPENVYVPHDGWEQLQILARLSSPDEEAPVGEPATIDGVRRAALGTPPRRRGGPAGAGRPPPAEAGAGERAGGGEPAHLEPHAGGTLAGQRHAEDPRSGAGSAGACARELRRSERQRRLRIGAREGAGGRVPLRPGAGAAHGGR